MVTLIHSCLEAHVYPQQQPFKYLMEFEGYLLNSNTSNLVS